MVLDRDRTIVLLSGGLDSTVTFFWMLFHARTTIDALTFCYGQRSEGAEVEAAQAIWQAAKSSPNENWLATLGVMHQQHADVFSTPSSITGQLEVDRYATHDDAVRGTRNDKSYLPLRNAVFVTLAGHRLLGYNPSGGIIVLGTRARSGGGFPDCTNEFATRMAFALSEASAVWIDVLMPLNHVAPSRQATVRLATRMPGCLDALKSSVSCFVGKPPCGECLPCRRRAQAFMEVGIADPALEDHPNA